MIRNCHRICEEKLQKNHCQRYFVAQLILDKRWKFQPDSSNGTPVQSDRTKAISLHLMLTSSPLQQLFDLTVAVWAVRNLLAANWVGVQCCRLGGA